jgi:hypothetical protein
MPARALIREDPAFGEHPVPPRGPDPPGKPDPPRYFGRTERWGQGILDARAVAAANASERDVGVGALQLRRLGDGPGQLAAGLAGLDDRVDDPEVQGAPQAARGGLVLGG